MLTLHRRIISFLKRLTNQERITLGLGVVATLIALLGLAYTIHNGCQIKILSFETQGLQHRPLLKYDEDYKTRYSVNIKPSLSSEDLYEEFIIKHNIPMIITVDPDLRVTNIGNSVANVKAFAVTDKYSGLPEIRDVLLKGKRPAIINAKIMESFYKTQQILPGRSDSLKMPCTINDINSQYNEFTIHYLVIYTNDLNNVFDSYYWVRYKTKPIEAKVETPDGKNFKIQIDDSKINDAIQKIDSNFSTYMYSKDESKIFLKLHKAFNKESKEKSSRVK